MYSILPLKSKIEKRIRDLPPAYQDKLIEVFKDIEANPYYHPTNKITHLKATGNMKAGIMIYREASGFIKKFMKRRKLLKLHTSERTHKTTLV